MTRFRTFVSAFILLAFLAGGFLIYRTSLQRSRCTLAFALMTHVVEFINAHEGNLPDSWSEIEAWDDSRSGTFFEHADELKMAIGLKWGMNLGVIARGEHVILLNAPEMRDCENKVNKRLWEIGIIPSVDTP